MEEPLWQPLACFEALRDPRGFPVKAAGLWAAGSLDGLARPTVAVVGTRAATPYGRRLAREFAAELGRAGCCIVSGLAMGIDACAHEGALEAGAPTVGVLGSGHRRFFPRANRGLAERMLGAGGAVLSPFAPDAEAHPGQFLERNGIVAALADAVVVIEAPARSGALNTAGWAAGRIPVLAVPGDVDRRHVAGCLALIRDGATLARGAADVLEALGMAGGASSRAAGAPASPAERALLGALEGAGVVDFERLVAAAGLTAPEALGALGRLELDGAVERHGACGYARL